MAQLVVQKAKPEVKVIAIDYEEWKPDKRVEEALDREHENEPYVFFKARVPVRAWYEWIDDKLKLAIEVYRDSKRLEAWLNTEEVLSLLNIVFSYIREVIGYLIEVIDDRIRDLNKLYENMVDNISKTHVFYHADPIAKTDKDVERIACIAKRILRLESIREKLEIDLMKEISQDSLHDLELIIRELQMNGDI